MTMVLYGPVGGGKTSFAAQFGRTGFIIDSQEQGINFLTSRGLVPPPEFIEQIPNHWRGWEMLVGRIEQAAGDPIDTLVVESLIGLQTICFAYHAKHRFASRDFPEGDMTNDGFYAFQKGPKNAAQFDWPRLMEALQNVQEAGKQIIITGHSSDKQETSPTGVTYQKSFPVCEKEIWARVSRWASIVGYLGLKVQRDEQASKGTLKKIAKQDPDRYLYLDATAWCEAKNWWGLTGVVDMGGSGQQAYENFMREINRPAR